MFQDRSEAGEKLAQKLRKYEKEDAVVLALPRGGVVTGYEIARRLKLPLDILPVRKIGHPNSPEYAICAVDEKGTRICDKTEEAAVDPKYLEAETKKEKEEAKRRGEVYREGRKAVSLKGKTVLLVDDGIATGLTMRLAVLVARKDGPKKIVVAAPVMPQESLEILENEAEEVVFIEDPRNFSGSVGAHYENFEQVEDDEVKRLLNKANLISETP